MSLYPDISHYHPVENWNQVKAECPFVISKATQGTGYIDETLDSFIKGCEANQISYWLYAYLNKGNDWPRQSSWCPHAVPEPEDILLVTLWTPKREMRQGT